MKKFLRGFIYAYKGLAYAFSSQINFRVHSVAAILVIVVGYYFKLNNTEWMWIASAIALVLIAELFNTALEVLVDLVSPGFHPKAGAVKDLASAAVLLTAFLAFVIGLIIFFPKLLIYLN